MVACNVEHLSIVVLPEDFILVTLKTCMLLLAYEGSTILFSEKAELTTVGYKN